MQIGVGGPLFPKQTLNIDHFFVTKPHHPIINVSNRTRLSSRSLPLVDFLWRLLFLKTRGRVARFCLTDLKGLSNPKMAFTFYRRVSDLKKNHIHVLTQLDSMHQFSASLMPDFCYE